MRLYPRSAAGLMLGATVMAVLAGCIKGAGAHPQARPSTLQPAPVRVQAAEAGGACLHFEYDVIGAVLGTAFDVAGKGELTGTSTCVLQNEGASLPDLTLAITRTSADPVVFKKVVMPKGAATVTELGRQAYSTAVAATATAGPGIEIGWLSGNARLMVLRYRFPLGTTVGDAAAFTPKMVELAKELDRATV